MPCLARRRLPSVTFRSIHNTPRHHHANFTLTFPRSVSPGLRHTLEGRARGTATHPGEDEVGMSQRCSS
ncbi:hypothetical protein E2C01_008574 [Portunus trituberculatus]|uniref:Uncharacterized protein n=1 Tax=Portunus trituberculatus TaxID=210409 RepID=A0A5B7D3H9_PORTR|nr:hypothetical protein [Portunus trituberculatus]